MWSLPRVVTVGLVSAVCVVAAFIAILPGTAQNTVDDGDIVTLNDNSVGGASGGSTTSSETSGDTSTTTSDSGSTTCGSGAAISVPAGGSIQAALDAASAGDALTLAPGTYTESITISKDGVALRGSGDDTIISTTSEWGIKVAANDVCVERLQINGPPKEGLLFQGSTGASALNVTISDASGAGVMGLDTNSLTLTNMKIGGVGVNGIVMTRVNGVTIQDSTITSDLRGIHLEGVRGSDIFRNTITGVGENGIVVERSTGPLAISHNTIRDANWGIWILGSNGARLEGDDVGQYKDQGIRVEGSKNTEIISGGVHDGNPGSGDAIVLSNNQRVSITGTTVNSAGVNALFAEEVQDLTIDGLRTFAMTRGIHIIEGVRATVKNIHIENPSENGLVMERVEGPSSVEGGSIVNATWGMWLIQSDDVTVAGTILEGSRDKGIRIDGSKNVALNEFTSRAGPRPLAPNGIDVFRSIGVTIADSTVTDTSSSAIIMDRTNDVAVTNTFIHNGMRGMHLLQVDNVRIEGNEIDVLHENGIVVETGRSVTVAGNELKGGQIGIWFRTGGDDAENVIRDNTVTGYLSSGISLDLDTRDHVISGNTVTNSLAGIRLVRGGGADLDQRVINNLLLNNTITNNTLGIVGDDTGGGNTVTGGTVRDNLVCDFFVVGDATLHVSGINGGGPATGNDPSKILMTGSVLGTCAP